MKSFFYRTSSSLKFLTIVDFSSIYFFWFCWCLMKTEQVDFAKTCSARKAASYLSRISASVLLGRRLSTRFAFVALRSFARGQNSDNGITLDYLWLIMLMFAFNVPLFLSMDLAYIAYSLSFTYASSIFLVKFFANSFNSSASYWAFSSLSKNWRWIISNLSTCCYWRFYVSSRECS